LVVAMVEEVVNLNQAHYCKNMAWERCESCKQEFFKRTGDDWCPNCKTVFKSEEPINSRKQKSESRDDPLVTAARYQAGVVDKFGEVLQILGYVCIAIFVLLIFVSLATKNWIGFVVFFIAIPLTFVYFNVFGSALRAVGLYIQIKIK
jgi:hypothetical protein